MLRQSVLSVLSCIDERLSTALAIQPAAIAVSGQAEDTLLLWRAVQLGLPFEAFALDTKKLHQETLNYIALLEKTFLVRIRRLSPQAAALAQLETELGSDGIYQSVENRMYCCEVRKLQPLTAYLKGFSIWLTGQRREQSIGRQSIDFLEVDTRFGLRKANPLFDFSRAEVMSGLSQQGGPPINSLYGKGYASIGCEPCTRAIRPYEQERAGRWWWESDSSKECGLHRQ